MPHDSRRMTTEPDPQPMTVLEAREQGRELVRQLALTIGDPDATTEVLTDWLDEMDLREFLLVSLGALYETYAACLRPADSPTEHTTEHTTEGVPE